MNAIVAFALRLAAVDAEALFAGRTVNMRHTAPCISSGCRAPSCALLRAADDLDP